MEFPFTYICPAGQACKGSVRAASFLEALTIIHRNGYDLSRVDFVEGLV